MTACDMTLTYIKNKSDPKIEPWVTSQDTDEGWGNLFPKLIRNDSLDK